MRRISDTYSCRLCGERQETVQYLLTECKKVPSTEYVQRHENIGWDKERWEKGQLKTTGKRYYGIGNIDERTFYGEKTRFNVG